jgi:serine/threonine-protein kinase
MMGTPAYMAPEQVLGREIDGRADLYSVGVVLYRLLTGHLPFNADTAISMVQMQISEPPTPMVTFKPDLPPWCSAIVDRALAKSPADRFQSAEEFRSALLAAVTPQALGEMPTLATPTPPGLALDDRTQPHRTPSLHRSTPASGSTAGTSGSASGIRPAVSPAPTPTNVPAPERTGTTVVLGRTHLMAMAALLVITAIGIAVLAFLALRGRSATPAQQAGLTPPQVSTPGPADVPAANTPAPTAAEVGSGAAPAAPSAPPPPAPPKPGASGTQTPVPQVATAGGAAKPAGRGAATPAAGTTPPPDGRGVKPTPATEPVSATPAVPPPAPVAPTEEAPLATFNQVRVLISEGERAREREGVLQLGGGRVSVVPVEGGSPIV